VVSGFKRGMLDARRRCHVSGGPTLRNHPYQIPPMLKAERQGGGLEFNPSH
jgi:hypothetical protein